MASRNKKPEPQPNPEQLAALERYAERRGRTWKSSLNVDWMRASYPGVDSGDAALLQQVRNQLGPTWLAKFNLLDASATGIIERSRKRVEEGLERVFASAEAHGVQSHDVEHQAGDLEDFARHLVAFMGADAADRAIAAWFAEHEEWTS